MGPYLTGTAQVDLKTMPAQNATNCNRVKAAILDHYEVMEETQRQCFHALCYRLGDRPKAIVAVLKEFTTRWLKPQTPGEQIIVDNVVLEQVFQVVPPTTRGWLVQNGPTSLEQVGSHLENYFLPQGPPSEKEWLKERLQGD